MLGKMWIHSDQNVQEIWFLATSKQWAMRYVYFHKNSEWMTCWVNMGTTHRLWRVEGNKHIGLKNGQLDAFLFKWIMDVRILFPSGLTMRVCSVNLTFTFGGRTTNEDTGIGYGNEIENCCGSVSFGKFHAHILDLIACQAAHVKVKVHTGIEVILCDKESLVLLCRSQNLHIQIKEKETRFWGWMVGQVPCALYALAVNLILLLKERYCICLFMKIIMHLC